MIQRCGDPGNKSYPRYGGRGIAVCERWREFENFLADMGRRPPGLSIERVDNDRGYEPGNCRWASRSEPAPNTRVSLKVQVGGRTLPLKTACEEVGLAYSMVWQRINRCGWSVERALGCAS